MDLTKDELETLKRLGFSREDVIDGTIHRTGYWQSILNKGPQKVAIRANPCAKQHRLFNRHNKCIVCDTVSIGFSRRHHEGGYVYILGSLKGRIVKIGMTNALTERHRVLFAQGYGGFDDWEELFHVQYENVGKVESDAHSILAGCRVPGTYWKDGKTQDARELFACSFTRARDAILATNEKRLSDPKKLGRTSLYEF